MIADELRRSYEEAMRDAFKEAEAIVDEAVRKAEARRRFHVDSRGVAVIAYADPIDGREDGEEVEDE